MKRRDQTAAAGVLGCSTHVRHMSVAVASSANDSRAPNFTRVARAIHSTIISASAWAACATQSSLVGWVVVGWWSHQRLPAFVPGLPQRLSRFYGHSCKRVRSKQGRRLQSYVVVFTWYFDFALKWRISRGVCVCVRWCSCVCFGSQKTQRVRRLGMCEHLMSCSRIKDCC